MLLQFRVTNHASIRDELELSFVAESAHSGLATQRAGQVGVDVLPAVAIYGANGSGKSNVIEAFLAMRRIVSDSHQQLRPGSAIRRTPFKLDEHSSSRPTKYEVNIIIDGTHYEYGFAFDDTRILSEWLYSYPKKRPRLFFKRGLDLPIEFGDSLKGERQSIARLMRPNSLFLSAAAANNHGQLTRLYDWFTYGVFPLRASTDLDGSYTLHEWQHHEENRDLMRRLLRYADVGIANLEVEEQEVPSAVEQKFLEFLKLYDPDAGDDDHPALPTRVDFLHNAGARQTRLSRDEESSGTLAWVLFLGPIVRLMKDGGVLVVDELDAYLHPLLAVQLVAIFQNPDINRSGAQLLFNTHNVTLLSPSVPYRLLRDQVWFTEKDETGATSLTPLAAYHARDKIENIEKRYLGGRYGAIPFFDESILDRMVGA